MRAVGVFLLVILLAAAVVLLLRSGEVRRSDEALLGAGEALVAGATPRPFDAAAARRALERLEAVASGAAASPEELAAIAARAASWAAGAPTGSAALTAAVALREAAGALGDWLATGSPGDRRRARLALSRARAALAGETARGGVQGIQDRLRDLEENERERLREAEEALR